MNNNGHISFDLPISTYDPVLFDVYNTSPLIAPYWADADTREEGAGTVWYRESLNESDIDRAQRDIRNTFPGMASNFRAILVFLATWDHVGFYDSHVHKVSCHYTYENLRNW